MHPASFAARPFRSRITSPHRAARRGALAAPALLLLGALIATPDIALAQIETSPQYACEARDLAANTAIQSAFRNIEELDAWALELLIELTEIPAPPFMEEANVETSDDILFVGVVGEEGLGDLRGMKHIYRNPATAPDVWIDVDGGGLARLVVDGLGSVRYRITFEGPGGHSWGAFGLANPTHAMSRAVRHFQDEADKLTRSGPRTSYNVGRIGGGTSVNAIPFESWMEVDMRSVSPESLARIEAAFLTAMDKALEEENALRRDGPALTVEKLKIGDRPSGEGDRNAPLVQRALATTAVFGVEGQLGRSSTDSNIPIALGIPAVTIGRGGIGFGGHSPGEYWINVDGHLAIQRALLLVVAEAGLAGVIP